MRTFLKALFTVSVLVNVFFLGTLMHKKPSPPDMRPPEMRIMEWVAELPESKQGFAAEALDAMEMQREKDFSMVDTQRETIERILTAEEFDKEAFIQASLMVSQTFHDGRAVMTESIAELASHLSQEQRASLADMLKPPPFKGKKHGDKKHP